MRAKTDAERVQFEDALRDLEQTVQRLESGELSLEDSLTAFEHGVRLVRLLNDKLAAVERRIEVLMRADDGKLRTRLLETEEK